MKSFSQNAEDLFVANYFGDFKGNLLDIGANQGTMLSNSHLLIDQLKWSGSLVEPAYVYHELYELYINRSDVQCYNLAIADAYGIVTLYESGAHVPGGNDRALVSSLSKAETERWSLAGVKFEEVPVQTVPFNTFWEMTNFTMFDFISMDIEGYEWMVLQQIDLKAVGCSCLCIEWNGWEERRKQFSDYCAQFGLREVKANNENLIFCA